MSTSPRTTSSPALLTLDEALGRLLGAVGPLSEAQTEVVSTFDALGRILAEDVRSQLDVPPADNSSMDGYAVRCADVAVENLALPVSQRIPAGIVGSPLAAGTAARIFHAAMIPDGSGRAIIFAMAPGEGRSRFWLADCERQSCTGRPVACASSTARGMASASSARPAGSPTGIG